MDDWERDYHVARVVSGSTRVEVRGGRLTAAPPSRLHRYLAAEVHRAALREAALAGAPSAAEAAALLARRGLWSPDDEKASADLAKAVEDAKVGLYENRHRSDARSAVRRALANARSRLAALDARRHSLDAMTRESAAASARVRFLTGASLLHPDGRPHWADPEADWLRPDDVVEEAVEQLARARLDDAGVRELARTEPWRSLWATRGDSGRGVFDAAAADLTEEQRSLLRWSAVYEAARDPSHGLDDEVVDDDDAFDGWLIVRGREREAALGEAEAGQSKNPKIRDAEEVYTVVDTAADAAGVERRNTGAAKATKEQRLAHLKRHKEVNEVYMPDTNQRIRAELTRLEAKHMKGG